MIHFLVIRWMCLGASKVLKVVTKVLSKCSNYPNSIREILAMSQNSIREILAMSSKKYFQLINFLSNFSSIHEKIQTPWTIQFYVVKNTSMKIFLWSKKHKFLNLVMFPKNITKFNFSDTIWIVLGLYFFHGFYLDSILDSWSTWTGYKCNRK